MTTNAMSLADIRALPTLEALYRELDRMDFVPGWVEQNGIRGVAKGPSRPARWSYDTAKAAMDAAGRLINTELAERRNLVMRNPNGSFPSRTLVSAYQMILPGEKARSHRHAAHALRVIIDAKRAFSVVDGEKTLMETGDVVLTPGWCWHGHGHDGDEPAYWFDGLDVPLALALDGMHFDDYPGGFEPVTSTPVTSPMRFRWDDTQRMLDAATADEDGYHGVRVRLDAPAMTTMALYVQRWESGLATRRFRATHNQVFSVMQGSGVSTIGEDSFAWRRGDTFVVPSWHWTSHRTDADAVLFSMTDEPLMKFCGYHRFEGEA
jgi:gentisate 1,2-dioxygenase